MDAEGTVLLSTSYFGSIQYFSKFIRYSRRLVEQFDHYTKQTYRNRCNIFGANGLLTLSVPVQKGVQHKSYTKDIRIDYSKNWRKLHWKGIESAYRHSPFFEFYMDDIRGFFDRRKEFLLDLNTEILDYLLGALEIEGGYSYSDEFLESGETRESGTTRADDCRELIHPKKSPGDDPYFRAVPYTQVFSERSGFMENLSIIDLLFNEGPNARLILEQCTPQVP